MQLNLASLDQSNLPPNPFPAVPSATAWEQVDEASRPRRRQRTARGRCGSLLLHRSGLAPPTPCRSPGAREGESAEAVLTCLKGWRAFHRLCERNFLPFTPKWIGRCDPRGVKLLLWSWLINAIARINRPSMIFTNQHRSY